MRIDIFDRRRSERFAQLLDETHGGRRHARDQNDEHLAELVAVGQTLSRVRPVATVDPEFRTSLRAMLVATAERDGIGDTAVDTPSGAHAAVREVRSNSPLTTGSARRLRARGAIVLGVAAGAMAVSGMSAASENAVPGDALYGVKRSTERAQLALASSDVTRGELSLGFARNRLAEASGLPGDEPAFGAVLDDMDDDTRQGVRLLTTSTVARKNAAPLGVIDAFVVGQRRLFTPLLDQLDPRNHDRALTSLSLLDAIDRRADGLRTGLTCGTDATSGTDSLGPRPKPCWAGADTTGPGGTGPGGTGPGGTGGDGTGAGGAAPKGTGPDRASTEGGQQSSGGTPDSRTTGRDSSTTERKDRIPPRSGSKVDDDAGNRVDDGARPHPGAKLTPATLVPQEPPPPLDEDVNGLLDDVVGILG